MIGNLYFVGSTMARFRWYEGFLSVGGRRGSVDKASRIRRTSLPVALRWVSLLWEVPVRAAVMFAGSA